MVVPLPRVSVLWGYAVLVPTWGGFGAVRYAADTRISGSDGGGGDGGGDGGGVFFGVAPIKNRGQQVFCF